MYSFSTEIRVRYAETDQMGYCYYGNYTQYFEIGRVETLRSLGVSYKFMEENGVMLPVKELRINYSKPALYDDLITIKTIIKKMPGILIEFDYEIYKNETLLTTGYTSLVFVNKVSMRPMKCPEFIVKKIEPFFNY